MYALAGIGLNCQYLDKWAYYNNFNIEIDEWVETTNDGASLACGYHAEYMWTGDDSVYFEIKTNQASTI